MKVLLEPAVLSYSSFYCYGKYKVLNVFRLGIVARAFK
jgi:hypothetical protein